MPWQWVLKMTRLNLKKTVAAGVFSMGIMSASYCPASALRDAPASTSAVHQPSTNTVVVRIPNTTQPSEQRLVYTIGSMATPTTQSVERAIAEKQRELSELQRTDAILHMNEMFQSAKSKDVVKLEENLKSNGINGVNGAVEGQQTGTVILEGILVITVLVVPVDGVMRIRRWFRKRSERKA